MCLTTKSFCILSNKKRMFGWKTEKNGLSLSSQTSSDAGHKIESRHQWRSLAKSWRQAHIRSGSSAPSRLFASLAICTIPSQSGENTLKALAAAGSNQPFILTIKRNPISPEHFSLFCTNRLKFQFHQNFSVSGQLSRKMLEAFSVLEAKNRFLKYRFAIRLSSNPAPICNGKLIVTTVQARGGLNGSLCNFSLPRQSKSQSRPTPKQKKQIASIQ